MGMFDWVVYEEVKCRKCGDPVNTFQSKDGNCDLAYLTPEQLVKQSEQPTAVFYGYCNDDDWNNRNKPHHRNDYLVTAPQALRVKRLETDDDE